MRFDRAVAVYILDDSNKVLLLMHKKLGSWLPPGGHIEKDELTHEAALREVREEVGVEIEFIYDTANVIDSEDRRARMLPHPLFVQLENVGDHYHEDFVYLARAKNNVLDNLENHQLEWFTLEDALKINIFDNVRRHIMFIRDRVLQGK